MSETIPIAADHAGYEMKEVLERELESLGYRPEDLGTDSEASTDYGPYAHKVAEAVENGSAARGVLLCGTGLGMSYAANRHAGVRAAVVWSPEVARLARQHNDANVLVLPARCIDNDTAREILRVWLETPFDGGRHQRRIEQIEVKS